MYVEDEPDIQIVVRLSLETIGGFCLSVFDSGDKVLEVAVEFAPDLFLLDVMMPIMDGPSTLKELRKLDGLSETPAVFMTAKIHPEEIAELKSLGALDVIAKPFDPMTLPQTIQSIWDQYLAAD